MTNSSIHGDDALGLLKKHTVYLDLVRDDVVGCVMASVQAELAVIHNLAVAIRHRKWGHATTLVRMAMTILDRPVPLTYWAAADPTNPSAVRRFHRFGFSVHDDGVARGNILMMREAGRPPIELAALHRGRSSSTVHGYGPVRTGETPVRIAASND